MNKKRIDPAEKIAGTMGQLAAEKMPAQTEGVEMFPDLDAVEVEEPSPVFEVAPGLTAEEMRAAYFDSAALIEPPYKVWQLNSKGHRYYYRYNSDGEPEFYPSVTTILSQTMPTPPHLVTWIANKGVEEAERFKNERAQYGTFMHAQFEKLLIERTYDLDKLKDRLKDYIEQNKLPENFIYYADDLKKDVLSFAQFVIDYDVRPLAVEIALVHPYKNYAGMIDCPCTMRKKIGSDERITAIVDFKSGKKGFFEACELQLHLYLDMWNENFPQHPIDRVYNFAPKDWRKSPTYSLKDQTSSPNAEKIPALLALAAIENDKKANVFTSVSGTISIGPGADLSENVLSLTLSELIKKKRDEVPAENATDAIE